MPLTFQNLSLQAFREDSYLSRIRSLSLMGLDTLVGFLIEREKLLGDEAQGCAGVAIWPSIVRKEGH